MADEKRDIKFQLMLSETEMKAIDDWSFANRVRTRAEAIRRLSQRGLLHEKLVEAIIMGGDAIAAALKDDPSAMNQGMKYLEVVAELGLDIMEMRALEAAITSGSKQPQPDEGAKD